MSKRKLTVDIGTLEEASKEFIDIWHQVESGKTPKDTPIERISFANERLLFKTLTPKRCDLLRHVHQRGKISIRALAKELNRDYSNVHQDVKTLHHVGLLMRDKIGKYSMPWNKIVTEIPMTLIPVRTKIQKHHSRDHVSDHVAHR